MTDLAKSNRPRSTALHPAVLGALGASLLTLVAVLWTGFGGNGYTALQLAVCTFFAVVFAGTPYLMWLVSRRRADCDTLSFGDWAVGDLEILGGSIDAREAALLILILPVAATAGLAVMGVMWRVAVAGTL